MEDIIKDQNVVELTNEQKIALDAVKEKISEAVNKDFIDDITRDNKMEFTYKNTKYRIAKPSYEQKQAIYKERVKKFTELLKDQTYSLEKDLKKFYLQRDIDIDAISKKIANLDTKKQDLQFKLGEILKKEGSDNDCKTLKTEIESIQNEQQLLVMEKSAYLEFSIENQVMLHMYNFMTYIITEKFNDGNWVKAFKSFQEFMQSDEELVGKLAFLITISYQDVV
jgi:uncharacterized protein (DUF885 family)